MPIVITDNFTRYDTCDLQDFMNWVLPLVHQKNDPIDGYTKLSVGSSTKLVLPEIKITVHDWTGVTKSYLGDGDFRLMVRETETRKFHQCRLTLADPKWLNQTPMGQLGVDLGGHMILPLSLYRSVARRACSIAGIYNRNLSPKTTNLCLSDDVVDEMLSQAPAIRVHPPLTLERKQDGRKTKKIEATRLKENELINSIDESIHDIRRRCAHMMADMHRLQDTRALLTKLDASRQEESWDKLLRDVTSLRLKFNFDETSGSAK